MWINSFNDAITNYDKGMNLKLTTASSSPKSLNMV